MYCNYCGKVIQDDASLCAYCGKRVGAVLGRRRLLRATRGRKIAGVCAGLAEYFDLDVTLIRLVWLVGGILMMPFFVIWYIAAWIVVPEEPEVCAMVPTAAATTVSPQPSL